MKVSEIRFQFVEHVPDQLEDGVVYISMAFSTAIHKCCCGCGGEVVTPFSPTDWSLIFDGKTISLHPSIGNWSFDCRSHYWIQRNKIRWAGQWSREDVEAGRRRDRSLKERYFSGGSTENTHVQQIVAMVDNERQLDLLQRLGQWWTRLRERL